MGTRENKVEKYLKEQVELAGGITRKWENPTYSVPDQIVITTHTAQDVIKSLSEVPPDTPVAHVMFVEVKTVDGVVSPLQEREINRLVEAGCSAVSVVGDEGVDELVDMIKPYSIPEGEVSH